MEPNWLEWARKLNALAQTGLTFAENPYDIERYTAIRTIAAEMIAHGSGEDTSRVLEPVRLRCRVRHAEGRRAWSGVPGWKDPAGPRAIRWHVDPARGLG